MGHFGGLNTGMTSFQGSRLEGVRCIRACWYQYVLPRQNLLFILRSNHNGHSFVHHDLVGTVAVQVNTRHEGCLGGVGLRGGGDGREERGGGDGREERGGETGEKITSAGLCRKPLTIPPPPTQAHYSHVSSPE